MEVAGSAVGVASLGIQICQGLLSYYDAWRGYDSNLNSAYDSINNLSRTLALLKGLLASDDLDKEKKDWVKSCLHLCKKSLTKLLQKCQKLQKYGQPEGVRQKAWAELQRGWYPFRAGTLAKLQDIVGDVHERLKFAVQVLQLDISTNSQCILRTVASDTSNIDARTVAIATSMAQVSLQNQQNRKAGSTPEIHIAGWRWGGAELGRKQVRSVIMGPTDKLIDMLQMGGIHAR